MDINELIAMVTEGLPADQAATVRAAIERDAVKSKAATLRNQSEWQALEQRQQALQSELDGGPDKPGAKAYREWYDQNYAKVVQLQRDYETLKASSPNPQPNPTNPNPQPTAQYSETDIQRMVDKRIQEGYAPRWSDLLTSTGSIVQKHMFSGRKAPIDFPALSKIAETKYQGNLELAYDEWDKPERDKADQKAREEEIERKVTERLQQRGASSNFPAGADLTPGALESRSKADLDKFDKTSLRNELANMWARGETGSTQ